MWSANRTGLPTPRRLQPPRLPSQDRHRLAECSKTVELPRLSLLCVETPATSSPSPQIPMATLTPPRSVLRLQALLLRYLMVGRALTKVGHLLQRAKPPTDRAFHPRAEESSPRSSGASIPE